MIAPARYTARGHYRRPVDPWGVAALVVLAASGIASVGLIVAVACYFAGGCFQ